MNKDGTFKGGFDGCVLHMRNCEGHSEDSAKKICGKIAQQVKGSRPEDWESGLTARADAADADGDETFHQHVRQCAQCKTGMLCQKGKTMMIAAMDSPGSSTAMASFAEAEPVNAESAAQGTFDLQWMPPGRQAITCFVNEKPKDVEFTVEARHALVFNSALQRMRSLAAAGQGDIPFTDFNHEDGAASGHPTEFYWGGDGPKGGIRMKGQWTGSGKTAVINRDFTRFSPQWDLDPGTQEPVGVKVNLGGLVNRAAFTQIQTVVAKSAANSRKENEMDRKEFEKMLTDGLKPITDRLTTLEAKAGGATQGGGAATAQAAAGDEKIVQLITTALKPLNDKLGAFEQSQQAAATATAKNAVQVHVNRGAIAPEDADTIKFYTEAFAKDAAGTEKVMAKLPGKSFGRIAGAGGATATATLGTEPQHVFMAKAKEFAKANKIEGGDAEVMTAFARTAEGRELYTEFRKQIHHK